MDQFSAYLSKRLALLRAENKISMYRLAQELNISRSTLSHIDTGRLKPSVELLYKLARFFNTSIDYLLGLTDFRSPIIPIEKIWPEGAELIRRAALDLPDKDKKLLAGIIATFLKQNEQFKNESKKREKEDLFPRNT